MRRMRILTLPLLMVALFAGTASAAPGDPYVVYTANTYTSGAVVLRTDPATGSLVEISRNGPQGNLFERPFDIVVEPDGNLLVADLGTPCVVAEGCAADGKIIRVDPVTGAQTLLTSGDQLVDPAGLALAPNGDLWVADNLERDNSGRIVRVNRGSGAQTTLTEEGPLDLPFGIAVAPDGSLLVANRETANPLFPGCGPLGFIVRVDPATGDMDRVTNPGQIIAWPLGLAVTPDGGLVVANECATATDGIGVVLVDLLDFDESDLTSNNSEDVLVTPERIAFDPGGALLVSDFAVGGDGGIVRVDPLTGAQSLVRSGELFNNPLGIASVVNRPPAAALAADRTLVAAGDLVRLDASGTRDPENLRLLYEWDLDGDGTFETGSGTTATATRSFSSNGPMTVRVRANDPHGGRSVAETTIAVDGAIPVITGVRLSSRVLGLRPPRSRRFASAAARRRAPAATRVRFDLSEPAAVSLAIDRARAGRRAAPGAPCRRRAKRGRRCLVWTGVRTLERAGVAGPNSIRLRARGLRPGRYRLRLTAADAVGNRSLERTLPLRVVRLPR